MKDNVKTFLLAGITFGTVMGVFAGIVNNVYIGIISGVFLGTFFGFFIWVFVFIQNKKFKKSSSEIIGGKKIIMEGSANHFKGKESVGGWIWLNSDEVIFKSHNFNFQNHQIVIPLIQIAEVKPSLTLGLVPNGLKIITINGAVEKFVVNKRKVWVEKIKDAMLTSEK